MQRKLFVAALAALAAACGGSLTPTDGSASAEGSATAEGASASDWSPVCPATTPATGSSCSADASAERLNCEYGYVPSSLGCETLVLECAAGQWEPGSMYGLECPPDAGGTASSLPADCPPDFASAQRGNGCSVDSELCAYDGAHVCQCVNEEALSDDDQPGPTGDVWTCVEAPPPCPTERPRIGAACSGSDDGGGSAGCAYGIPMGGGAVQCVGEIWVLLQ